LEPDLAAHGDLAEQQRGSLLRITGVDGAEDLGPSRGQLDPRRVRVLGQSGGYRRCGPWSTADADRPVRPAEPLRVELAHHPHHVGLGQLSVAAGDGLLRRPEDFRQAAERCPGIDVEGLDDPSVQGIDADGFHVKDCKPW
jgi:hypothetical protein